MPSNRAFTLLELLVVITIIGILSSIVVVSMSGSTDSATIAKGKAYAQQVHALLGHEAVLDLNFNEGGYDTCSGSSDVCDASSYGNHGTIYNNEASFVSSPVDGYALSFDGSNDYVNCGKDANLDSLNYFTVLIWVKSLENNAAIAQGIISKANINGTEHGWILDKDTDNKFHFRSGPPDVRSRAGAYSDIAYTDQSWHCLVGVHNNTENYLYVDGMKQTATQSTTFVPVPNINLVIGTRYGDYPVDVNYSRRFNGLIDEVRIYAESLSSIEIQKHYVQGLEKLLSSQNITKEEYNQRMIRLDQSSIVFVY